MFVSTSALQSSQTNDNQNFGVKLLAARKAKKMSVEQVATELNILKRHVEAIESQDYEALPQFPFARGFVANYAKLVELPADELVHQFDSSYPKHLKQDSVESIKSPVRPMGTLNRGRAPIRINFGLILGVIALLALAMAILKMVSGTKSNITTEASNEVQIVDTLSPKEQAIGASIGNVVVDTALTQTTPVTTENTTQTAPVVATGEKGDLALWVKSSTAITVKDATGEVLMSGNQGRGGYHLAGQPPLQVEIEKPKNVDITFNKNFVKSEATLTIQ